MDLTYFAEKMQSDQALSESEQKEFFSLLAEESDRLKKENPDKYIELLKELHSIVSDLNQDIQKVREQLKS